MVAYGDVVIRAVPRAQRPLEDLTGSGVAAGDDDRRLDAPIVFHPCSLVLLPSAAGAGRYVAPKHRPPP